MARKPRLTDAQLAYARRCDLIVRKAQSKMGRAAVAHKLGLGMSGLSKYLSGETQTLEQWEESLSKNKRQAEHRRLREQARKNTKSVPIGHSGLYENEITLFNGKHRRVDHTSES